VFARFVSSEAGGSVMLLASTAAALIWANSPWGGIYDGVLHTRFGVTWETYQFSLTVHEWVNDGLMALFFFVVGLEIKREVVAGQLSSARQAALPAAAALGGMLVPAGIYALFNAGGPGAVGWGIPMATDIAFALGVLALLGPRVPVSLKVFLTALAIADDLGAVLVLALFYTTAIRWPAIALAVVPLGLLFFLFRTRIRRPEPLFLAVVAVWVAVFASGLHATVAGILVALTVPMTSPIEPRRFVEIVRSRLPELEAQEVTRESMLRDGSRLDTVVELYEAAADLRPPGLTLERVLHPIQAYVVLPLFALFNAGVAIDRDVFQTVATPIGLGVILGLVGGKPLGVMLSSWLAVRLGLARLPADAGWASIFGVSWLCGIGFTMSLFIGAVALREGPPLVQAKTAILGGSLAAALTGYVLLRLALPARVAR
jgi:NhaA family Na+:H+ antiporter